MRFGLHRLFRFTFIVNILCVISVIAVSQKTISLIENWQFRLMGNDDWLPAVVPGSVHLDLLNNKMIKDPFYGEYQDSIQWIEKADWEYKTSFTADEKLLKNDHIEIIFEGLDTYADIYINNTSVLLADNMFREWKVDRKKLLKKGANEIKIQFFSPIKIAQNKSKAINNILSGEEKYFLRKAAFHFGNEYAPRMVTTGIWKPVTLKIWNTSTISNIQILQKSLDEKKASLTAIFEIISDKVMKSDLIVLNKNLNTSQKKNVSLKKGLNIIPFDFKVDNPKFWWTNGLGDAYLYNFEFSLVIQKQTIGIQNISIGLRNLEVIQEKDSSGMSFYFKLNGIPLFIKGAGYVPQDIFTTRVDSSEYARIFDDVATCNMNMLHVRGDGIYQDKIFYDLCDKNGILVMQDFMFSDALYPRDSSFIGTVKLEAIYQVKRLRNHPCIGLWCGNNGKIRNTLQEVINSETDSTKISNDYMDLFQTVLPDIVKTYDIQRTYFSGLPETNKFEYSSEIQGMPVMQSIKSFVPADEISMGSVSIMEHQSDPNGFQIIQINMDREYNQPKDFEDFVYLSGLLQAYRIKETIEKSRCAKPGCMGFLQCQLNDCWPAISSSGIDYYERWKPLQYFVIKAFGNLLISIVEENEEVKIFIVSDKLKKQIGTLWLKAVDFSGKEFWKKNFIAEVPGNTCKMIYKIKTEEIFAKRHRPKMAFIAELKERDSIVAKEVLYFVSPKEMKLTDTKISKEITGDNGNIILKLKTETLVKNVFISFDGDVFFSNNYFDMMPGETVEIRCSSNLSVDEFARKIKISSLFDSYISK